MEQNIRFPETVFLIDSDFINHVITDIKRYFSKQLNRELPAIALDQFITFLSLDASIKAGEKEIMVILVHEYNTQKLEHCNPSFFKTELNDVAFKNNLGEFQFTSISPEGIVKRQELYLNLLDLITESSDVKRIILIPFEDEYIEDVLLKLKDCTKEVVLFGMNKPGNTKKHQWQVLAYPLMQALGIKGNEI
jgi:hypothetical protein